MNAAAVIMHLQNDGREMMNTRAGIRMMRESVAIVKGTRWEESVFPSPLEPHEKQALKEAQEILKGSQFDYWSKK